MPMRHEPGGPITLEQADEYVARVSAQYQAGGPEVFGRSTSEEWLRLAEDIERSGERDPAFYFRSISIRTKRARAALDRGEPDRAVAELRRAEALAVAWTGLDTPPKAEAAAEFWLFKSMIHRNLGDMAVSEACVGRLNSLIASELLCDRTVLKVRIEIGDFHRYQGNLAEAENNFLRAGEILRRLFQDSQNPDAGLLYIAGIYNHANDSIACDRAIATIHPGTGHFVQRLGRSLEKTIHKRMASGPDRGRLLELFAFKHRYMAQMFQDPFSDVTTRYRRELMALAKDYQEPQETCVKAVALIKLSYAMEFFYRREMAMALKALQEIRDEFKKHRYVKGELFASVYIARCALDLGERELLESTLYEVQVRNDETLQNTVIGEIVQTLTYAISKLSPIPLLPRLQTVVDGLNPQQRREGTTPGDPGDFERSDADSASRRIGSYQERHLSRHDRALLSFGYTLPALVARRFNSLYQSTAMSHAEARKDLAALAMKFEDEEVSRMLVEDVEAALSKLREDCGPGDIDRALLLPDRLQGFLSQLTRNEEPTPEVAAFLSSF